MGLDLSQSLQGAGGIGGLIATVSDTDINYHCYELNGNKTQLLSEADGTITAHIEYDPFGNDINSYGLSPEDNPFRFSTKYHDPEYDLYYYGYRYYVPDLGRWLTRDPIGEDGGLNFYNFALNTPTFFYDLLGFDFIALALRPLTGMDKDFGVFMHSSIEYWECPCNIVLGDEYSKKEITKLCQKNDFTASVELLNSPDNQDWVIWENFVDHRFSNYWKLVSVGISEIVYNRSSANRLSAFIVTQSAQDNNAVATQWQNLLTEARRYDYAEQEGFTGRFRNWPNSKYGVFENNCHTFSWSMINSAPGTLTIPDMAGILIRFGQPKEVSDRWGGRKPVYRHNASSVPPDFFR